MSAYLKEKGCGRQLSISFQALHSRFCTWKNAMGRDKMTERQESHRKEAICQLG